MTDIISLIDLDITLNLLHLFGVIIAVGAVFSTDIVNSLLHFSPKFAVWDAKLAPMLSLMVWIGFFLLSTTGTLLFLQQPHLIHETVFQLKMLFVAIIFVNGVFLNAWVTPRFQELADQWQEADQKAEAFEFIAGLASVISVAGWVTVVVLGYLLANVI